MLCLHTTSGLPSLHVHVVTTSTHTNKYFTGRHLDQYCCKRYGQSSKLDVDHIRQDHIGRWSLLKALAPMLLHHLTSIRAIHNRARVSMMSHNILLSLGTICCAQQSIAWPSTAQHSTAQHGMVKRSTAPCSASVTRTTQPSRSLPNKV